jgi:hypothetical protein
MGRPPEEVSKIKAEIRRLEKAFDWVSDTGIVKAIEKRIAELKAQLKRK